MPDYAWVALGGALMMALGSLLGKAIVRYRICDAGLLTWSQGLANALVAGVCCVVLRRPFPLEHGVTIAFLAVFLILASWLLNHALQEGDASTVVPLMGLKIPLAGVLAALILGEEATGRTWVAVACAGLAVALFGAGAQRPAQGGHGRRPSFAMLLVVLSCLAFAICDLVARHALDGVEPVTLVLWSNVFWAPVSAAMLHRKRYRKYRIRRLDLALFLSHAVLIMGAILCLYTAFRLADGVILPNVVFGTRGFFVLAVGFVLNKALRVPMERQSGKVYALRATGTLMLFGALTLALMR